MSLANAKACKKCGKSFEDPGDREIPFSFDDFDVTPAASTDGILEAGWKVDSQVPPPDGPAAAAPPPPKAPPRRASRKRSEVVAKKFEGVDPEELLEQVFDEPPQTAAASPLPPPATLDEPAPEEAARSGVKVPIDSLRIDLDEELPQDIFQPLTIEREGLDRGEVSFEEQTVDDGMLPLHLPEEDTLAEPLVGVDTAGFARRGAAFTVDSLIILAVTALHTLGAGIWLAYRGVDSDWLLSGTWLVRVVVPLFLLGVFISALYHVGFVWLRQATPGKRLFSLMVASPDGGPLGLTDALLRWMGYIVSAFPFGLGFFWALYDQHRLTWHDRLSGTLVMTTGRVAGNGAD